MAQGAIPPQQVTVRDLLEELRGIIEDVGDRLGAHTLPEVEAKEVSTSTISDIRGRIQYLIKRSVIISEVVSGI